MAPMNDGGSKNQVYGGMHGKDARYVRRQRQRMNFVSVVQCLFIPWILFCIVFGVTSFHLHYEKPWLCWTVVGAACLVVLAIGTYAASSVYAKMKRDESKEPTWCIFLFITCLIGVSCGVLFGNQIFWSYMQTYYEYLNLNDYNHVNPAKMRGQQVMDGARISFDKNTTLDLRKAMGFKNLKTYCVAPITFSAGNDIKTELATYDFWAVGTDCCSDDNSDFHCGEFNNPKARSGLRLLEDDERPFYRLAVQQAEAMYHIKATHPLFLYWTEDPVKEMESWKEEAHKYFFIGMLVHFFWQMMCVGLGVVGFSTMGKY